LDVCAVKENCDGSLLSVPIAKLLEGIEKEEAQRALLEGDGHVVRLKVVGRMDESLS